MIDKKDKNTYTSTFGTIKKQVVPATIIHRYFPLAHPRQTQKDCATDWYHSIMHSPL